jgi:hypothetical protein
VKEYFRIEEKTEIRGELRVDSMSPYGIKFSPKMLSKIKHYVKRSVDAVIVLFSVFFLNWIFTR